MSDPKPEVRTITAIFAEAEKVLNNNKALSWTLGQEATKAALQSIDSIEGQEFINDYLLKILSMMTQQSPAKLGPTEKTTVEEAIMISLKISIKLLNKYPNLLGLLARAFDPKIPYYHGTKAGYNWNPGFPQFRIQAAKKFHELKGFHIVAEVLKKPDWPGSEAVLILLNMVNSQEMGIDDRLKEAYILVIMDRLLSLPDELLKKENTDIIGNLINIVGAIHGNLSTASNKNYRFQEPFYQFWFKMILKFMNSSSLVIKLFGWEQINEMIVEIKGIRPLPGSFTVEGAGTEYLNGVYNSTTRNPEADNFQYTKVSAQPGIPLLTLFRCTMRNTKAKWWFISQADLEKPGTDKDIDYYLHKSSPDDEREPPAFGWTRNNPGMNLIGVDPAPVLKRGNVILPKGYTREMCIDMKFLDWTAAENILSLVFTSSVHRETVSRTLKYLLFLAEYEALSIDHLRLIWKSGIHSSDHDVMEEIFHILVQLTPFLNAPQFSFLMDLALENMKNDDLFPKVMRFVEKFSSEDYKYASAIHAPEMQEKFLSLLWIIYMHPETESLKSSVTLQDLLSFCFKQKGGKDVAFEKINESRNKLREIATSETFAESNISRIVQTLSFLISRFNGGGGLAEEFHRLDLVEPIVNEILRFMRSNRINLSNDERWYISQLHSRFQVLRKFFAISNCEDLTVIHHLWNVARENTVDLNEFFVFLKGDNTNTVEPIFSNNNMLNIFTDIICSQDIDWSGCGEGAFECFRSYASELETYSAYFPMGTELPPKLGLSTLWRIVLSISSEKSQREATDLLLQSYDAMFQKQSEIQNEFLKIIFDDLQEFLDKLKSNMETSNARAERSIYILTAAVHKFGASSGIAHAARSCTSRLTLSIYYRRTYYHHSQQPHLDPMRIDKGSDGVIKIEVHPFHTVKLLKAKIADVIKSCQASNITLDNQFQRAFHDNTRLYELGIYEGQELSVSYQVSYQRQYDDELYGGYPYNKSDEYNFAQLLSEDYSKFDCLLSLCQESSNNELLARIWELLMLLPTQPDLMDMIQSTANSFDSDLLNENSTDKSWEQIFDADNVNPARKAYLLQIIDSLLRPAPEVDPKDLNYSFRSNFLRSEGLQLILKSFLSTPTDSDIISFTTLAVCLNVLFFLVFDQSTTETGEIVSTVNDECLQSLTNMEDERTSRLLEKLLYVAHNAAAKENSSVVHSALVIITLLIRTPAVASQLIGNDYSKALLGTVLRSTAKKVREIASDFAVQVGKAQPVVFTWLLQDLEKLPANDELCSELFHGLSFLLLESKYRNSEVDQAERKQLGKILSTKLVNYPRISPTSSEEKYDLLGYLQLMNQLINIDAQAVLETEIGPGLIKILLSDFLFVLDPSSESNSLCDTSSTRRAAFGILSFLVKYDHSKFEEVLSELNKFAQQAGKHMHYHWGLQVSHDIKKSDIKFTGLKNQGCTCYSNSVLQTLFMTPKFRDAILGTPLRESHRSTLWHRKPEDLVDMSLLFELLNGSWRVGKVVAYDSETTWHTIHYLRNDGSLEEAAVFNIHEGRYGKESGRVRVLPEEGQEPLTEREEGAFRVLEQLQRTFCFLKLSKRKYFDPRPLVEACKTLNLNFNVYHQNDATEFYDQLLDRIETATKGKHTKKDMWNDVFLKEVFGGKWLTQKIPMDCDAFNKERDSCGHWQSSRVEDYLKVELIVRGKEKIDDSLDGLVQGELMDGDNKIQCEVCAQKKATTRRTCFGSLPNTLILHLKRFDLDFQTFETVKLNSKMTFPNVINMLKYTKEGIDISEAEKATSPSQGTSKELSYQAEHPSSIDPSDFEYELQGVLVHAGVAQGGHYYSFVRDGDDKGKWFRFDDEDVTPFNPDNIPVQCFGGSSGNQSNSHHMIDDDRTANALMLFYTKVKKTEMQDEILVSESNDPNQQEQKQELPPSDLVDGLQAFQAEVMQSNLQHLLTCYLVDPELHNFVRGLISAVSNVPLAASYDDEPAFTNIPLQWSPTEIEDDLPLRTVKFGSEFLLNVALHCRERPAVRSSIMVMKGMFEKYPHTAYWFVLNVLTVSTNTWLNDYLVSCNDALARATFVQLFVHAVNVIAPRDPQAVVACNSIPSNEIRKAAIENAAALCWLLVRSLFDLTLRSVGFSRNADEIYVLIRDLASIPALCTAFKTVGMVSFLSYFIMPDQVPVIIRNLYEKYMTPKQQQQQQQQNYRVEYTHLLQSVFEAIAALLGVPQIRKVNLLHEKSYWESELVAEAKDAFTQIFNEVSRNGVIETLEATQYLERVSGSTNSKNTAVLVRSMLDRFGSHLDGKLYLDGFLQYQADVASYNPKQVWRDLHAFGYRNDLSRNLPRNSPAANSNSVDEAQDKVNQARSENLSDSILNGLTENCRQCLSNIAFYESGLVSCEPAARAIAQRICFKDIDASSSLIHQALSRLHVVIQDNTWSHHPVSLINDFLRFLLNIDDGLQTNRFHVILFSKFGLASMALSEKEHPSNCRANEYNKTYLFERYITFIQDLVQVKGILDCLTRLAKEDPKVKTIKGMLRLRPGSNLTDSEDAAVRNTIVILENAGVPEVNGEYHFVDLKNHAGYYSRTGPYREKDAKFTLYKCSLRNGGFQWFVSITPENMEPGTTSDMDFYYAPAKTHDYLPPAQWTRLNANHTRDPAPKVRFAKKESSDEDGFIDDEPLEPTLPNDSDSDREFDRILDDSNTSFDQGGNFV